MMVRRGWNAGKSPPPGVTIKRMFRKRKSHWRWKDVRRAIGLGISYPCGGRGRPSQSMVVRRRTA